MMWKPMLYRIESGKILTRAVHQLAAKDCKDPRSQPITRTTHLSKATLMKESLIQPGRHGSAHGKPEMVDLARA